MKVQLLLGLFLFTLLDFDQGFEVQRNHHGHIVTGQMRTLSVLQDRSREKPIPDRKLSEPVRALDDLCDAFLKSLEVAGKRQDTDILGFRLQGISLVPSEATLRKLIFAEEISKLREPLAHLWMGTVAASLLQIKEGLVGKGDIVEVDRVAMEGFRLVLSTYEGTFPLWIFYTDPIKERYLQKIYYLSGVFGLRNWRQRLARMLCVFVNIDVVEGTWQVSKNIATEDAIGVSVASAQLGYVHAIRNLIDWFSKADTIRSLGVYVRNAELVDMEHIQDLLNALAQEPLPSGGDVIEKRLVEIARYVDKITHNKRAGRPLLIGTVFMPISRNNQLLMKLLEEEGFQVVSFGGMEIAGVINPRFDLIMGSLRVPETCMGIQAAKIVGGSWAAVPIKRKDKMEPDLSSVSFSSEYLKLQLDPLPSDGLSAITISAIIRSNPYGLKGIQRLAEGSLQVESLLLVEGLGMMKVVSTWEDIGGEVSPHLEVPREESAHQL